MSQRWKWRTNLDRHKKDRQAPRSPQTLMQSVTFGCVHIYIHTRDRREFICLFRREGNRGGGERRNSDRSDGGRREGETQTQQRNETERERQMQWMEMCSCCCFTSCWLWRLQSINAFSHCVFFLSVDSRLCTPERIWLCNELQINKADGRHRAAQTGVHVSVFVAFTHMYEEPVEWSSLSPGSDVWAEVPQPAVPLTSTWGWCLRPDTRNVSALISLLQNKILEVHSEEPVLCRWAHRVLWAQCPPSDCDGLNHQLTKGGH